MRAAWLVALVACSVPEQKYTPLPMPPERQVVVEIPDMINRDLDILLVVDDSAAMQDKQLSLANALPALLNQLSLVEGGLPNVHIGVITTDMGTSATEDAQPGPDVGQVGQGGCSMRGKNGVLFVNAAAGVSGNFVSDIKLADNTRQKNYTGTLDDVLGLQVKPGMNGCGFEQPLSAMKAALANNPSNAGFLRPQAKLAVVFLTDEDDCSPRKIALLDPSPAATQTLGALLSFRCTRFGVTCDTGGQDPMMMNTLGVKSDCHSSEGAMLMSDVEPFHSFLASLKTNPGDIAVAVIAGDAEPFQVVNDSMTRPSLGASCMYTGTQAEPESAVPPSRLVSFLSLFPPDRTAIGSICGVDQGSNLDGIGQLLLRTIGTPCLTATLADTDPNTPGVQEDCVVEDIRGMDVLTEIDKCGVPPCWRLENDPASCPSADHLKLVVDRGGGMPPPNSVTKMLCKL